jgi:hypothetical protein
MEAVFEVLVHFDRFRNIDLFRQGMYYLRVWLYQVEDFDEAVVKGKGIEAARLKKSAESKSDAGDDPKPSHSYLGRHREALPYACSPKSYDSFVKSGLIRPDQAAQFVPFIDSTRGCFCTSVFRVQYIEQIVSLNEFCQFRVLVESQHFKVFFP